MISLLLHVKVEIVAHLQTENNMDRHAQFQRIRNVLLPAHELFIGNLPQQLKQVESQQGIATYALLLAIAKYQASKTPWETLIREFMQCKEACLKVHRKNEAGIALTYTCMCARRNRNNIQACNALLEEAGKHLANNTHEPVIKNIAKCLWHEEAAELKRLQSNSEDAREHAQRALSKRTLFLEWTSRAQDLTDHQRALAGTHVQELIDSFQQLTVPEGLSELIQQLSCSKK